MATHNSINDQELQQGDYVIYPDGNARFGGLHLMLARVQDLTPRMVRLVTTKYPLAANPKFSTTAKYPEKLLKINVSDNTIVTEAQRKQFDTFANGLKNESSTTADS